jgi:hypothetical protein
MKNTQSQRRPADMRTHRAPESATVDQGFQQPRNESTYSMPRSRTRVRIPTNTIRDDAQRFVEWLNDEAIVGDVRASVLSDCYLNWWPQASGRAPGTPRQLFLALGALGIKRRRPRVRDRRTGRVAKLPSGAPVRETAYSIPEPPPWTLSPGEESVFAIEPEDAEQIRAA